MKKILAIAALLTLSIGSATATTHASPIPQIPGCGVYDTPKQIPLAAYCYDYYYDGHQVAPGFSINE